ncbi:type II secretion system F family protein [Roseinatronobacter sp. S2]|uniref:type II secretion system F family protein n=1 Tax=Roseinatronobacter sp. S2 TaxID=3035471 RepID=UPI002410B608|nr:type II secretion system F family protein [Roseinatronobacter sp. S2]WFE77029.1 type II secretion system F family protein [Roseinatronobacter sp. S2]
MVMTLLLFLGILLTLTSFGLLAIISLDRKRQGRAIRISRALDSQAVAAFASTKGATRGERARRTARFGWRGLALDAALQKAGIALRSGDFLGLILVGAIGSAAFAHFIMLMPPMAGIVAGLVASSMAGWSILCISTARRASAFAAQMPTALDTFARALRAGRPVSDALDVVVQNTQAPLKLEMEKCRDMLALGHSLNETLRRLADRVDVPEVRFFSVATHLQSETGGNLVETIEHLAEQLRERLKLKKKIRALSAEARASAMILGALPFAIAAVLFAINADYLLPLVQDARGRAMTGLGLASLAAGMLVLFRMGRLDV